MIFSFITFSVVLIAAGALRWRLVVPMVLLLAVFEGALRKWLFPEYAELIYLAKDLLLVGAYLAFFPPRLLRHQGPRLRHPANIALILLGLLAVLELANPLLPNLAVGFFGIKSYLGYAPMLYLVPATFRRSADLRRFLMWFTFLALIPLVLGVAQFWSPVDSVLNQYAWETELAPGVAVFGEASKARITGTFSYISGHSVYLTLIALIGLVLISIERRRWHCMALGVVLVLTLANLFMTGSRGPFLILGFAIPVVLALSGLAARRLSLARCVVLGIVVLLAVVLAERVFPDAVAAFVERVEANEDVPHRVLGIVREPLWALGQAGLAGYGIGTTHQAALFLGSEGTEPPPPAEGEWERIILEVGPIGFVLTVMARLLVIARIWAAWRTNRERESRALLSAALMFVVVSVPGNLVFNHTAALFYWFMAGVGLVSFRGRDGGLTVKGSTPERRFQPL